jgi:hypothetical protein
MTFFDDQVGNLFSDDQVGDPFSRSGVVKVT